MANGLLNAAQDIKNAPTRMVRYRSFVLDYGSEVKKVASRREAARLNPNDPQAHYELGAELAEKSGIEGPHYLGFVSSERGEAERTGYFSFATPDLSELDGAVAEYRKALSLNQNFARAHYGLGHALLRNLDLEAAISEFRETIRLGPNFADAHRDLGDALEDEGDFESAIPRRAGSNSPKARRR
jgi:tetratricopeptide (TPR) repeat protein